MLIVEGKTLRIHLPQPRIVSLRLREHALVRPVEFVADHGAAERREMKADLMLPAGEQRAADERVAGAALQRLEARLRQVTRLDDAARVRSTLMK